MQHDPLSDVLRSVNLRGKVFYYVSCRDKWVAGITTRDDPKPIAVAFHDRACNSGAELPADVFGRC